MNGYYQRDNSRISESDEIQNYQRLAISIKLGSTCLYSGSGGHVCAVSSDHKRVSTTLNLLNVYLLSIPIQNDLTTWISYKAMFISHITYQYISWSPSRRVDIKSYHYFSGYFIHPISTQPERHHLNALLIRTTCVLGCLSAAVSQDSTLENPPKSVNSWPSPFGVLGLGLGEGCQ